MTDRSSQASTAQLMKACWRSAPTAVTALALLGLAVDDAAAQSGRKWFGSKPAPVTQPAPPENGFAATIARLLEDARRQAATGQVEEAIKTAQRARKIAEASSAVLRGDQDVSTAAADDLLRDLYALRGATAPASTVATATPRPAVAPAVPQAVPASPGLAAWAVQPAPSQVQPSAVANAVLPGPNAAFGPTAPATERPAPPAAVKPRPTSTGSSVIASSRSSTSSDLSFSGFAILGGEAAPVRSPAGEPEVIVEPVELVEIDLGAPVKTLPLAHVAARSAAPPITVRPKYATVSEPPLTSPMRGSSSFSIVGGESGPSGAPVIEPVSVEEPVALVAVELGEPVADMSVIVEEVPTAPTATPVAASSAALPTAVVAVRPFVPAFEIPSQNDDQAAAVEDVQTVLVDVDLGPATTFAPSAPVESPPEQSRVTVWANRTVPVAISEPVAEMLLTPTAPEPAPEAAAPTPIPRGHEPALAVPTEWNAVGSQAAAKSATILDTAWESADRPAATLSAAPGTSNGPAASAVIESPPKETEDVTPVGFTKPEPSKPVAPPPPSESEPQALNNLELDFERLERPAWVRESIATAPHANRFATASRGQVPAKALTAGLAAIALALLGLGLTFVRYTGRRRSVATAATGGLQEPGCPGTSPGESC